MFRGPSILSLFAIQNTILSTWQSTVSLARIRLEAMMQRACFFERFVSHFPMTLSDPAKIHRKVPKSSSAGGNVGTLQEFEETDLYKGVYAYVEDYMSRYDMSHDFNHILRVLSFAKRILESESEDGSKKFDEQAIVLAALLHDVGDKKYLQPGEVAETMITGVLQKNGCPTRLMSKVALIVEHVSFSSEIKRPQLVKAMVTAHPELGIVQDADRLDAIGAVGIARCFAFGGAKASGRGLHGCIEHFVEKLENLQGMMKTEAGRRLAEERTRRLQEFRGWWDEENAGLS